MKKTHADYADDADKNRKVDVLVNQKENRYGMNRMKGILGILYLKAEGGGLRAERKNGARRLRR